MNNSRNKVDISKKLSPNELKKKLKNHKILFVIAILYTISPIDLIPDFTPFIGVLDDMSFWLIQVLTLLKTLSNNYESVTEPKNELDDTVISFKKEDNKYKINE